MDSFLTTVTDQITYKEQNSHGHVAPMNNSNSTEPMDQDSFSGSESIARSDTNDNFVSETLDPYICMWDGCRQAFDKIQETLDPYICMWDGCRQAFDKIQDFAQHIKVAHIVEERSKGRGEYVCLWDYCERAKKPYYYQSYLLTHIRKKHSGEDQIVSKTI